MILEEIRIEKIPNYRSENGGKYEGKITYQGAKGSVTVILNPEVSGALLQCIGGVIAKFSAAASREIEASIQESIKAAGNGTPAIEG